jgi:TonB-linked SusC/RagA family outer membrane protein
MKKLSLFLFMVLFAISATFAQRTVTGNVVDEEGEPLIGASVLVKGTSSGTVTDLDGNFSLDLPDGSNTLVVSYTGFGTQDVDVTGLSQVSVTMAEGEVLQTVVIQGYTQVEERKLVSSVAVVDNAQIENVTLPDVNQIVQGRAPGVFSTASSGQPGAAQDVIIRGKGSFGAGSGPLYVIDGIIMVRGDFTTQTQTNDVLSNINPNDIDNVTVLKDAAATALYGSRGSNGVIMITTKRGKIGKTKIVAKVQRGVTSPNTGNFQMMNAQQAWDYERKVLANSGRSEAEIDALRPASMLDNTTDWIDEAFREGSQQNYELQASGGNEKTRFFLSGGYYNQEGTLIESTFNRYTLRSNIDHKASDRLDLSVNMNLSYTDNLNAVAGNRFASPLAGSFTATPLQGLINPDTGELYRGDEADYIGFTGDNFVYSAPLNPNVNRNFRSQVKFGGKLKIIDNLYFSQNVNLDFISITENSYQDATTNDGEDVNGRINDSYNQNFSITSQSILQYDFYINDVHSFDIFTAFEYLWNDRKNFNAGGTGLASGDLRTLNSTANPESVGGFNSNFGFTGILGQIQYNYSEKYFLSASFRRDASSRFGDDFRWGNFWSVGTSWRLDQEEFIKSVNAISKLRIRASVGTTGNASIGNFPSRELYGFGAAYTGVPGSSPSQIANPEISWEESFSLDVGLDFGFFKDRISGTFDWYSRETRDLLFGVPVSATSGFTAATRNLGKFKNTGIELAISTLNIATSSGFEWSTDFNITMNDSKVVELPDGEDVLNGGQILREGFPIRSWYRQRYLGVNPADGTPLWDTFDDDGVSTGPTGNYAQADRILDGNAEPDFFGGFNNNLSFKGFTISTFFYFAVGHEVYNGSRPFIESDGLRLGWNHLIESNDHWENPGDIASRPQPLSGGNNGAFSASSRYLEDGSYLRLRNVTVSYNLPTSITDRMHIGGLKLYVTGQNLWTLTDYSGFDPEMDETGSEFFRYPVGKSYSVGIDVTF